MSEQWREELDLIRSAVQHIDKHLATSERFGVEYEPKAIYEYADIIYRRTINLIHDMKGEMNG